MISFIITLIKLIIILCVVTTIHEFGHFIISKLFKTGVEEFSIGFGPAIFQKKFKDTTYSLRWIPLGGYCAIEGEDGSSDKPTSFAKKNTIQKLLILVAGATFNAILAVIIFLGVALSTDTYTTKITGFSENSVLEAAGVSVGDEITKINGKKVKLQEDLFDQKFATDSNDVTIEYIHDGEKKTAVVSNAVKDIGYIGVAFKLSEDGTSVTNEINMVSSGSAAVKAGLKAGDKITKVDGEETSISSQIIDKVRNLPNKEVTFEILRDGNTQELKVTPISKRFFDLQIASTMKSNTSISLAITSAVNNVKNIVGSYVDLFKGKVGIKDMSGIVGIGEVVSKTSSLLEFFNLMGIISLAIGVANVMPFPPLDGGKMVMVLYEAIARKKIPEKAELTISYIGFAFLIILTVVVTFNDIVRII